MVILQNKARQLFVLLSVAVIPAGLWAQERNRAFVEGSQTWEDLQTRIARAVQMESIPAPILLDEPIYTQGTSNDIWFKLPPLERVEDALPQDTLAIYAILIRVSEFPDPLPVRIIDSSSTRPRFAKIPGLDGGTTYQYTAQIFIEDKDGNEFLSPPSEATKSTQDAVKPTVKNVDIPQDTLPFQGWLNQGDFDIHGHLFDPAGVWQAKLYRRQKGQELWGDPEMIIPFDTTLTDSGIVAADSAFAVFDQRLPDGMYEFRIEGVDATNTPRSAGAPPEGPPPSFALGGNEQNPDIANAAPQDTIYIDTTPPDTVTLSCTQILNCITLSWTRSTDPPPGIGLRGYLVLRDGVLIDSLDARENSYEDCFPEKTPDTTFTYQVQPFDSLGNVQTEGGISVCPFRGLRQLTMKQEPQITSGLSNTVCWNASEIFVSFKVFVDENCDGTVDTTMQPGGLCATIENLSDGVQYCYWVEGTDEHMRSVLSDTVRSTQDDTPPLVEVELLPNVTNAASVEIDFLAEDSVSAAVDSAFLWFRISPVTTWTPVDTIDLADESPVDSMFVFDFEMQANGENGIYEFFVAAVDTAWAADNSSRMGNKGRPRDPMATILYDTAPPDTVTLTCTQVKSTIELWWTPSDDGRGVGLMAYRIYRDGDSVATVPGTVTHYSDVSIDSRLDSTYHYHVMPVDSLGNEQNQGGRAACPFWGIPQISMILDPEITVGTTNTVCWRPDQIFIDFQVFRDRDLDSIPDDSLNTPETCATFTGLEDSVKYYYWVRGEDEHGRFVVSDTVHSRQDATPPKTMADPLDLCLTAPFDVSFKAWDTISASVDSARLYFRHDSTAAWQSADLLLTDLDETMRAVSADTALMDSIRFVPDQDGYVEFYVTGKDTARAADAVPGSQLTGRDGNWGIPETSTVRQAFTHVDTQEPHSEVTTLDSVQKTLCFEVPYLADDLAMDGYESGLRKVNLFYRFEADEAFSLWDMQAFTGEKNAVKGSFSFTAIKGDGNYFFYTVASDSCGNLQAVNPDTVTTLTVVKGTPQILTVNPANNSFNFADSVRAIEFYFDRPVRPIGDWADVITISNEYAHDQILQCDFELEAIATDSFKVTCKPAQEEILATSLYLISVDKSQIIFESSALCDTIPAIIERFAFYTVMERVQGGQVWSDDVKITVIR